MQFLAGSANDYHFGSEGAKTLKLPRKINTQEFVLAPFVQRQMDCIRFNV